MNEEMEMELKNEVEETIEDATEEVTDLVPVNDESEDSIGTGEKMAGGAILVLALVGTAAIVKKGIDKVKEHSAKKKEKNEMAEIDRKMKEHPGFLGKFKKNKKTDEVDPDPEKDNEE